MVRKTRVLLPILIVGMLGFLVVGPGLTFQNEPEGFRELKWGDPPGEDMEKVDSKRYRRRKEELPSEDFLKGIELRCIYYLFYKDQFTAVEIGLRYRDDYECLKDRLSAKFGISEKVAGVSYMQRGDKTRIYLYKAGTDTLEIHSTKIQNQIKEDKRLEEEALQKEKEEAEERQDAAFMDFVQHTYGILMDYNPNDLTRSIGDYLSGRISQRDVLGDLDWARMLTGKDLKYFYELIKKKEDARAGRFLTSEIEWAMFIFLGARLGAIDYASDMIKAKKIKIGKVTEEFYLATGLTSAQTKAYYKALEEVGEKLTF